MTDTLTAASEASEALLDARADLDAATTEEERESAREALETAREALLEATR